MCWVLWTHFIMTMSIFVVYCTVSWFFFQLRIDMKNFDLNSAFTFNLKAGLQPQSSDGHVSQ